MLGACELTLKYNTRLRTGNSLQSRVIALIPRGTHRASILSYPADKNGYKWLELEINGKHGYMAHCQVHGECFVDIKPLQPARSIWRNLVMPHPLHRVMWYESAFPHLSPSKALITTALAMTGDAVDIYTLPDYRMIGGIMLQGDTSRYATFAYDDTYTIYGFVYKSLYWYQERGKPSYELNPHPQGGAFIVDVELFFLFHHAMQKERCINQLVPPIV